MALPPRPDSVCFDTFEDFTTFYDSMAAVEIPSSTSDPPETEPKIEDGPPATWRSLFAFTTKGHVPTVVTGILITAVASLTKPVATIFFGQLFGVLAEFGVGKINTQQLVHDVSKWCIALTALGGTAWILEGIFLGFWLTFGELQAWAARQKLFNAMLNKEMSWFDLREEGIGALLGRIQTQIRELQLGISQPLGFLVYELFDASTAIGIAFFFGWQLSLVMFATFPIVTIVLWSITKNLGPAVEAQKHQLSQASKYVNNSVTAIDTVKAYNGQDHEVWQYLRTMRQVAESYMIQAQINSLQFGVIKFVMVGLFVQGFWFGLYLVNHGADPAHIVTTFYACLNAIQSIEVILPQWLVLAKAVSAGNTLRLILSEIQEGVQNSNSAGTIRPEKCEGDIEVRNMSFSYPLNPEQNVLQEANFFFPSGETTFIVGASGSGKSTLGNLLMKYYESPSGEILIDGMSIKVLDTNWVRQNITLVQQGSVLFNETVLQNIAFGRRDHVSRAEVMKAAGAADLEETLSNLPNGIDTLVGSGGKSLSGGQQQRVAIARARLRNTPILILDEAISALDPTSKPKVMQAVREWRKGKTTIVITHEVSQILDDQYVYVMEHGKVVQEGYRGKLAAKTHGLFASFLSAGQKRRQSSSANARPVLTPQRRQSVPAILPISPDSPDWHEIAPKHRSTLSRLFLNQQPDPNSFANTFSNITGDRRTAIGTGASRASVLWTDMIWNTPEPKQDATFQSPQKIAVLQSRPPPALLPARKYFLPGSQPIPEKHGSPNAHLISEKVSYLRGALPVLDIGIEKPKYRSRLGSIDGNIEIPGSQVAKHVTYRGIEQSAFSPDSDDEEFPSRGSGDIEMREFLNQTPPDDVEKQHALKPIKLGKIFLAIWPNLKWQNKINLIVGFIFAFIVAVATPAFAYILAQLLAVYYAPPADRSSQSILWASALLGIAIIDGFSTYMYHCLLEHCGQAWVNALRVEALKRILAQPKAWFDKEKNSPGRLSETLDRNAEEMRNLIGRFAGPVFVMIWMVSISVGWAIIINWKLTLVALATAPIMYAGSRMFNFVTTKYEDKCGQAAEYTSSIFAETFGSIRVVRALTLESYFLEKHSKAVDSTYLTGWSRSLYSGLTFGFADSLSCLISALVFYYGSIILAKGEITTTAVLQVFNLLLFGLANSLATVALIPQISLSKITATQMLFLANLPYRSSHETKGTKRLQSPFPIVLNNLSFTYPSNSRGMRTLTNLSLTINPNTCTAIVGPSGCGKSTLSALLLGLYPPDNAPSLTFSGTPVNELSIPSLRNYIALVSQNSQLFPVTIYENIIYGLPEGSQYANINAVKRSAEQAGIAEFIDSLGQGYETLVGDGGQTLSGGQMQRLSIARALVRKPKVLILDEVTSALDAVSAESVRETVRRLRDNRSHMGAEGVAVVLITHSIEMMSIAEEVVVLENGQVVEKGGFQELRAKGGKFADLIGMERLSDRDRREMEHRLGFEEMTPVDPRTRASWMGMGKGSL